MLRLRSERLIQQFEDALSRASGKRVGAVIRAESNLDWVVFHEFGTAARFSSGTEEAVEGITVTPPESSSKPQGFNPTPGSRLPITEKYNEAVIVPSNPPSGTYINPGVTPKGAIQSVLPDTISPITSIVAQALLSSNIDMAIVQTKLVEEAAPLIVEAVGERLDAVLDKGSIRDTPGRLDGESPSDVFSSGVGIEPLS